jgi:hypothetical protein
VEARPDPRHTALPTENPPHPFGLFASPELDRIDRFAQDLLGCQRRGRVADQDAARRGERLQA